MSDNTRMRLASCLYNGAYLKDVGSHIFERLMDSAAPEFQGRLEVARKDAFRHATILRDLANRLGVGASFTVSDSIPRLASIVTYGPTWILTILCLTSHAFEVRIRALVRRTRQLGYVFLYDPLMEMAADEATHRQLALDILQAGAMRPKADAIRWAGYWVQQVEGADRSGFFPSDGMPARAAADLIEDLGGHCVDVRR